MDEKEIYQKISTNIVCLRTVYQLTQQELAERSGVSKSLIAKIEVGERHGSLKKLELIANGLGITLTGLIEINPSEILDKALEKYKIPSDDYVI